MIFMGTILLLAKLVFNGIKIQKEDKRVNIPVSQIDFA